MFAVNCPHHRSRVLLWSDNIETIVNGPAGIEVHWRCPCGGAGVLRTGAPAVPTALPEDRRTCIPSC
jgi:hypothetical protein